MTADEPIMGGNAGMGLSPTRKQEVETEVETEAGDGVAEKLAKLVNGNSVETAKAQMMAQMASDPQIRALLEARQRGEQVEVILKNQRKEAAPQEEAVDWDSLTNSQMAEKLPSMISSKLADQVAKMFEEKFAPFQQEFEQVKGVAQRSEAEKVTASIKAAQAKYPDFDAHRADMLQLSRETPGLNAEELYVLNKVRKGLPLTPARPTATERPTQTSARPSAKLEKKPFIPGKRGMASLLEDALANKDFTSVDED